jgi:HlyD family secretion protein
MWVLLAAAAIFAAYLMIHFSHQDIEVRTAVAERQNLVSTISTNGKVEPVENFQAHATEPSIITQLPVQLGQHIAKDQLLVVLNASDAASHVAQAEATEASGQLALRNLQRGGTPEELLSAKSDLAAAQQQAKADAAQLNTLEALQANGSASAAEVSQARDRVTDSSAKVAALKSRATGRYTSQDIAAQQSANTANAAALNAARSAYANVSIRAPFAGTLYWLPVARYDSVPAGDVLLAVADLSKLRVRAYFDEPEIGKLTYGQAVKIVWDAKPDLVWHGHIEQPPTTVTTYGTRNVGQAIITVDDTDGQLLPDTNVTVTVTTTEHKNVLTLPREALHTEGVKDFVYRIINNRLVRTEVDVPAVNLTRVEIRSGIQPGDQVALGDSASGVDLTNGMKVKPQQP